jgi:hypothetical protein
MKKLLALLLFVCSSAFAGDYVATIVPGSNQWSETGSFVSTVTINVVDAAGRTNTQAQMAVVGSNRYGACSGRGCGVPRHTIVSLASAAIQAVAADGTLSDVVDASGNPVTMTYSQIRTGHAQDTFDAWTATASVPVGSYRISVAGAATCLQRCGGGVGTGPWFDSVTETSDALPVTYWWTGSVDPSLQALGVPVLPTVIQTFSTDTSGPQMVCDLYDQLIQNAYQAFLDMVMPGAFLLESTTATVDGAACTYHITYQDLVNAPGVDAVTDTPSGNGSVGSCGARPARSPT